VAAKGGGGGIGGCNVVGGLPGSGTGPGMTWTGAVGTPTAGIPAGMMGPCGMATPP